MNQNLEVSDMAHHHTRGFTLIELMIALVIVAILAGLALPAYQDSVIKSRRSEAKAALLDLQNRMERFFIDKNTYNNACITGVGTCASGNSVLGSATTENGYYQLSITVTGGGTGYTLKAAPQGAQTKDTKCQTLTLTNTGAKGVAGPAPTGTPAPTSSAANCW